MAVLIRIICFSAVFIALDASIQRNILDGAGETADKLGLNAGGGASKINVDDLKRTIGGRASVANTDGLTGNPSAALPADPADVAHAGTSRDIASLIPVAGVPLDVNTGVLTGANVPTAGDLTKLASKR